MKIPELELVTVKTLNWLAWGIKLKTVKVPKYCWEQKKIKEKNVLYKKGPNYSSNTLAVLLMHMYPF